VKALASPLANVDHITVVSTGNGDSAGLHKITGDLTQIAAQVPELFEALSGMKMSDLFGKIAAISDKLKGPDQLPPPDGTEKAAGGRK
jgi:flotillin